MKRRICWILVVCFLVLGLCFAALGEENHTPLPIVFSKHYDITLFGIQKLHPFDSEKYGRVFKYLKKEAGITKDRIFEPDMVSEKDLLRVHTQQYLASLKKPANVARIAELGALKMLPGKLLEHKVLKPMKYGTGGTILACQLALQYGWSINLSGGYHHAKADQGDGFCFFADIPIAAHVLWDKDPDMRIMIVDLDAHQGNGHEAIFADDPRVFIYDMYNDNIYPGDTEAAEFIDFNLPIGSHVQDEAYLTLLKDTLEPAIIQCNPNIIIYNAGTDIFENDPLGNQEITDQGVIKRDSMVFETARKMNVPVAMVLSGGYTKESAEIIARSITNLLENVLHANAMRVARAKAPTSLLGLY
ncbi:MAG: histone deacetylase [Desulfatibacillum sp.]|nr:histone deacetylase [Desulfatibacillum sp.]